MTDTLKAAGEEIAKITQQMRTSLVSPVLADYADAIDAELEAHVRAELSAVTGELPEAFAWATTRVVDGKVFYEKLPIQSTQPGFYKHTKLYTADQMRAYAAHLHASEQGWMPIESAPRDGTAVLAWCDDWLYWGHFGVMAYDGVHEMWMETGFAVQPAPTHWQPLPRGPKHE
jgi:hypothetical protein